MSARRTYILLAAALLTASVLLAGLLIRHPPSLPEASAALVQASQGLDEIVIDAQLHPDDRSVTVRQVLQLTNRTGQDQPAVVLRTWPNAFQSMDTSPCAAEDALYGSFYPNGFSAGALVMSRAEVNGSAALYRYTDEAKTVLRIPVPNGWADGATIEIALDYVLQLPRMAYRFGIHNGVYALGNAFAIPAVWQDGAFRTDAYAPVGDPFLSECANYTVTATVPKGYVCAGSGHADVFTENDQSIYRFHSLAVRDFALAISDRFETAQALEDDVLVIAHASDSGKAKALLTYARKALKCYESLYGDYPYQSFTLAEVPFPLDGMEYPAFCMIGADAVSAGGRELEYAVAHETAHQWWYAVVGSDSWNQSWQDEALCEFSLLQYAQSVYGAGERADLAHSRAQSAMRVSIPAGVTPGSPLSTFVSMSEYKLVVYDRGAACMIALDEMLPGGLDSFLQDYYTTYAFMIASRNDFEDLLAHSTGMDLTPLLRDYLDTQILN